MEEVTKRQLTALLRGGLIDETVTLPPDADIAQLTAVALRQRIAVPILCGFLRAGFSVASTELLPLVQAYGRELYATGRQQRALAALSAAFAAAGVDYMPLKGAALRTLYARPELRSMGDIDILIRREQYAEAAACLQACGFVQRQESVHEWIFDNADGVQLELHKSLFPPYERELHGYFGDGWEHAVLLSEHRFALSATDGFVYLFAHFAKHYRNGGVGLRQLADLWLCLRETAVKEEAAAAALESMGLLAFYRNMRTVLAVCFDGVSPTAADRCTPFITETLLSGGCFGCAERQTAAAAARTGGSGSAAIRMRRFFRLCFPTLDDMRLRYPVLRGMPLLLPLLWAARGARLLLCAPHTVVTRLRQLRTLDGDAAATHRAALAFVGLADGGERHE